MGERVLSAAARIIRLIRYRFLLFAGLFPFGLGQVIAWHEVRVFQPSPFLIALVGLVFVLIGVEAFNEYFDARIGTDRVFTLEREEVPFSKFAIGLGAFAAAAVLMVILAIKSGWPVVVFAVAGFLAAAFYVMPPIKLVYRGFGELAILLSYGPMMTAGSYFIQAQRVDAAPFIASVVPALLVLCVTVANQVPDFFGDRIVGKRNITVRLGRRGAVTFSGGAGLVCFGFIGAGVLWGFLPRHAWLALLPFPLALRSFLLARHHFDNPRTFVPAIRGAVLTYTTAVALLAVSYLA